MGDTSADNTLLPFLISLNQAPFLGMWGILRWRHIRALSPCDNALGRGASLATQCLFPSIKGLRATPVPFFSPLGLGRVRNSSSGQDVQFHPRVTSPGAPDTYLPAYLTTGFGQGEEQQLLPGCPVSLQGD